MKFSSEDILQQQFERRVRGYDSTQVREFLEVLSREWDLLASEVKRTQRERDALQAEVKEFRKRERSLQDSLDMARQMAEDLKGQAERKAEVIVADAELKAERVLAEADAYIVEAKGHVNSLTEQRVRLEAELRSILHNHLRTLDAHQMDMDDESVDHSTM